MGKKKVLVSYGVDIDAVAGWLGSYGGEDSASDISRGELPSLLRRMWELIVRRVMGRNYWNSPPSEIVQQVQHQSVMVYSWPFA